MPHSAKTTALKPIVTVSTSATTVTNVEVWGGWNHGYACDCCTTSVNTWSGWNVERMRKIAKRSVAGYTIEKTDTAAIWVEWNVGCPVVNEITTDRIVTVRTLPETPEQIAAREQAQRELAAAQERSRLATLETERQRAEAKDKAYKLLMSALDGPQKEELKTKGFFTCKSKRGNLYRIYKGSHGNVKRVERGKEVESLCVQPSYVPEGDCMLAQKLHIENDEDGFRQAANIRSLTIH